MNEFLPYVNPILFYIFIAHILAFGTLAVVRKMRKYYFLVSTFIFLSMIYGFKIFAWAPHVSMGEAFRFPLQWVLRAGAILSTLLYLAAGRSFRPNPR